MTCVSKAVVWANVRVLDALPPPFTLGSLVWLELTKYGFKRLHASGRALILATIRRISCHLTGTGDQTHAALSRKALLALVAQWKQSVKC